jgi:hypothetical protein
MRMNSEVERRFNVFLAIIGEEQRLGRLSGSGNRRIVHPAVWFHRAYFVRKNSMVEIAEYGIFPLEELDVRFIRVRDEY